MIDYDAIRFELTNIEILALELAEGNCNEGELKADLDHIADAASKLNYKLTMNTDVLEVIEQEIEHLDNLSELED